MITVFLKEILFLLTRINNQLSAPEKLVLYSQYNIMEDRMLYIFDNAFF